METDVLILFCNLKKKNIFCYCMNFELHMFCNLGKIRTTFPRVTSFSALLRISESQKRTFSDWFEDSLVHL